MKSKKYYIDLINHNKIIKESETLNSNGDINLNLWLSPTEHSSNKMTINELAKVVSGLADTVTALTLEVREGFKQVNRRLDEHDAILKQHSIILNEHSAILKQHSMLLNEHSEILARNNLQ